MKFQFSIKKKTNNFKTLIFEYDYFHTTMNPRPTTTIRWINNYYNKVGPIKSSIIRSCRLNSGLSYHKERKDTNQAILEFTKT